ncbi:MAG: HAMP domain-containing protein [Legionellaceae bacterium]|nr:HAMP domain-containing protein [Legionellaceae bacterium]
MHNLYWKIFISFWLATILIILTTAWVTSEIAQKSSIPAREKVFMDSHATAAIATLESGHHNALLKWLKQTGQQRNMDLFLLSNTGEIISHMPPPASVRQISHKLVNSLLDDGLLKSDNRIISHEIVSTSGHIYRLVAVSETPLSHFVDIPWAGLSIRLTIAVFFSGLICYLLSLYLTHPLRSLRQAARSLATGKLHTRVGTIRGHTHDEIAELSRDFDRMAEQLEQLILAKERLLSDISHELRSPLTRLQIAIEIARDKTQGQALPEFNRMELECLRLNQLIGEILEFARLSQSAEPLNAHPSNIRELLDNLIQDVNYEFGAAQPRVQWLAQMDVTIPVYPPLIHRALENILRNALRYSPVNTTVLVSMHLEAGYLTIDIDDQGPGVPETEIPKIFSPFYRVDCSREKKTGGYGLGLAIAHEAILLHKGYIEASNRIQGGLRVRIGLPLSG